MTARSAGALVPRARLRCRRCGRCLALSRFPRGGPSWRAGRSWWCATCAPEVAAEREREAVPAQLSLALPEPERDPAAEIFD